jgi:hypothetical protein
MLQNISDEDLKVEVERRKKESHQKRIPVPLDNIDFQPLLAICHDYIHELATLGYAAEDYSHYIFEAAVTAIYGKDVWAFVNHPEEDD